MKIHRWTIIVVFLFVSFFVSEGCVGSGPVEKSTPPTTTMTTIPPPTSTAITPFTQPAGLPEVFILSPEFDAGIPVGNVTVVVEVNNFRLVPPNHNQNIPSEGHLIYYRDVVPPVMPGKPAYTAPGTYAVSADISYTWYQVPQGTHTFSVQLVNNDDTPLQPPVITDNDVTAYGGRI